MSFYHIYITGKEHKEKYDKGILLIRSIYDALKAEFNRLHAGLGKKTFR